MNKKMEEELVLRNISHDDITSFGLIPEFVGRVSNIAPLDPLREEDLVQILTKPQTHTRKQSYKHTSKQTNKLPPTLIMIYRWRKMYEKTNRRR